jgi:hypothetical protein
MIKYVKTGVSEVLKLGLDPHSLSSMENVQFLSCSHRYHQTFPSTTGLLRSLAIKPDE